MVLALYRSSFYINPVTDGRWEGDNDRLCVYGWRDFRLKRV